MAEVACKPEIEFTECQSKVDESSGQTNQLYQSQSCTVHIKTHVATTWNYLLIIPNKLCESCVYTHVGKVAFGV